MDSPRHRTGKIFSKEELSSNKGNQVTESTGPIAVCDEVYGKLVYDKKEQIRFPSEHEGESIDCIFVRKDVVYYWMENMKGI